jgi:hypothetical protein
MGLTALSPHVVPLALLAPVLVDQVAAVVGLAWLLTVTARRPGLVFVSPLLALIVVLVREAWALPLLACAVLVFLSGQRLLGLLTGLATLLGLGTALTAPALAGPYSSTTIALHSAKDALLHPLGAVWSLAFGAGVLGLLGLLVGAWSLVGRRRGRRGVEHASQRELVAVVGVAHLLLALVGGADVSRLAAAALPYAIALAVAWAVELPQPDGAWLLVVGVIVTALVWRPWIVVRRGEPAYFARYYPGPTLTQVLALVAVVGGVAVTVGLTRSWRSSTAAMSRSDRKPRAGPADT